ncbi:MAG TPA: 50S ribosomal protein L21 [Candidatus Cybelea sp.]|nr:50S ribosomal protein L21 [Candidatus Cybelea sp.]
MYAVIKTGGKQYKVANGDVILVERLEAEQGQTIALDQVLMIGDGANITVGQPTVQGASVAAEVVEHPRADKVIIFKKNRRHNYRRKNGHRQLLTALKITEIRAA